MSDQDAVPDEEFDPSFTGTLHEKEWIGRLLADFHEENWLTDVLFRVKGGKEATVYCCKAHPATGLEYIAAKVFRPRIFRAMRNDWLYRQGRVNLDQEGKTLLGGRTLRALKKKTAFGQEIQSSSWCQHEFATLRLLHEAGADVPRPLAASSHAILMEYVGDGTRGAPVLQRVALEQGEAQALFERLMWNVELMLSLHRVHADLSAYNVLYWEGRASIIDLPQAVDPQRNPAALALLTRDIERLCQYFARQGVTTHAGILTADLWRKYLRGEL